MQSKAHYHSIGTSDTNPQLSEQSQTTVVQQTSSTGQVPSSSTQKGHHNSMIEPGQSVNKMILTQTNLSGSGNLNSSLKKAGSVKPGIRTSTGKANVIGSEKSAGQISSKRANASRKLQNTKEVANIISKKVVEVDHKGLSAKMTPGGASSASNAHHSRKSKQHN